MAKDITEELKRIYEEKGELTERDIVMLLRDVEDIDEYEKSFKMALDFLVDNKISLKKYMKVSEKEEYVQSEETDTISKERQDELISKLKDVIEGRDTVADFQLNGVIGEVTQEDYEKEYQFLLDYIKSQGITLRGTSIEMENISELNGNETERTAGPGEVNYKSRKQEEQLEEKKEEKKETRKQFDETQEELSELRARLKTLEEGTTEYNELQAEIQQKEGEEKELAEELKEDQRVIGNLGKNLPTYVERRNKRLFAKYVLIRGNRENLEDEQYELGFVLKDLKQNPEENAEEIQETEERLKEVERQLDEITNIRNALIENNIRLVGAALYKRVEDTDEKDDNQKAIRMALRYLPREYDREERMQEGYIALIKAIDNFDPNRGVKFSSYAIPVIRSEVYAHAFLDYDAIENQTGSLDFVKNVYEQVGSFMYRYSIAQEELERDFYEKKIGRKPTIQEIAQHMGETYEKAVIFLELAERIGTKEELFEDDDIEATVQVESAMHRDLGPVHPWSKNGKRRLQRIMVGQEGEPVQINDEGQREWAPTEESTPEAITQFLALQEEIAYMLVNLEKRERDIVIDRFGFKDGVPKLLEEVASEYEVSPEKIRQIESRVLAKLRHPSRSGRIKEFVDIESALTVGEAASISDVIESFSKAYEKAMEEKEKEEARRKAEEELSEVDTEAVEQEEL